MTKVPDLVPQLREVIPEEDFPAVSDDRTRVEEAKAPV